MDVCSAVGQAEGRIVPISGGPSLLSPVAWSSKTCSTFLFAWLPIALMKVLSQKEVIHSRIGGTWQKFRLRIFC